MCTIELKNPIKVIPSDNYLLMIKDGNNITHYWHKEHTSIKDGKEIQFKEGQYDGHSRPIQETNRTESENKGLKKLIMWMTGCPYDFTKHEYFIKKRDKLLKKSNK
ncbi:MAG: hypothetical protein IIC75_00320 [Bacteroidetes bacterium]|nr:hypothetical protein [Bacteroidota bacterium]